MAPGEGAVVQVQQWGPLLLYSTQRGVLHAWDLRMDRDAWQLPAAPSQASQTGGVAGLFQEGLPASRQWAAEGGAPVLFRDLGLLPPMGALQRP